MKNVITVAHTISMGHRLPSYKGICSSLHGHNVRVEVDVVARQKFVDFKDVQKALKKILEPMDHAMVLSSKDPLARYLTDAPTDVLQAAKDGFRVYVVAEEPTTEYLAVQIRLQLIRAGYEVDRCTVYETDKYSATVTP